jgi:hypothetical protein
MADVDVSSQVTVFWRSGYLYCWSLRSRLRRAGRQVDEVNIWEDPAGAAFVRSSESMLSLPPDRKRLNARNEIDASEQSRVHIRGPRFRSTKMGSRLWGHDPLEQETRLERATLALAMCDRFGPSGSCNSLACPSTQISPSPLSSQSSNRALRRG